MVRKIDKYLYRFTFISFPLVILYGLLRESVNSNQGYQFLISVLSHMFVLLPLVYFTVKEKKATGNKQRIYSSLSFAFLAGTISYWLTHKFDVLNDYFVIGLFVLVFIFIYVFDVGTEFVTGFILTYLIITIIFFFNETGTLAEKVYSAMVLKNVEGTLSLFWWLMILVGYVFAKPPAFKKKKRRQYNRMKDNKQNPNRTIQDLDQPVFRKPNKVKSKIRKFVNKP